MNKQIKMSSVIALVTGACVLGVCLIVSIAFNIHMYQSISPKLHKLNKLNKLDQFANSSYILPGHKGGEGEYGERDVAFKFTRPSACVLEFGGGSGSVSAVVQRILNNPKNHVVIQPKDDPNEMFGGARQLKQNKMTHNLQYTIIDYFLRQNEQIDRYVTAPFDTMIVDCENCLVGEYKKNPHLFEHVTQIQVERDDKHDAYTALLKDVLGMRKVYSGIHSGSLEMEVWERDL